MERDDVHAVFFDAGYTLLCMDPPQETLFLRTCDELDVAIDTSKVANAVRHANELLAPRAPAREAVPYSPQRVDAFWIDYHRAVLAGCAIDPAAERRAEAVYRRFTAALGWRVYDDVRPSLNALRQRGIALGVISNWTGDLEDVLRRIDLHDPFDFVIDSAHFGHEKPHPEIFAEAVRRAGVPAAAAMHIGDSIEHDVDGARRAGLRAVLIDRKGDHAAFATAPRVSNLIDIVALL